MSSVFDDFLHPPEVLDAFGSQRFVAAMLRVEAALAQAQAQCGVIPASAAVSIVGTCKVDLFDAPKIVRDSGRAGSLAIPLVKSLKDTVSLFNPDAVPYVHFACTKQDLVDTDTALITRDVLERLRTDVQRCAQRHRRPDRSTQRHAGPNAGPWCRGGAPGGPATGVGRAGRPLAHPA